MFEEGTVSNNMNKQDVVYFIKDLIQSVTRIVL